ncbi:MAG: NADH:flavin oxidoreductase [Spirochaetaceae bacterium]|nr:NADH:flavin oxidoreductase [Spirochaetaceae bacterium]
MNTPDPFSPVLLGRLKLRNRLVRSGCYEGLCRKGEVSPELIEHHRRVAEGGVSMTTLAYGCVAPEGRTFADQIVIKPESVSGLKKLVDAVHREGAAISIQLTHGGYFADPKVIGRKPLGASKVFNNYRFTYPVPMSPGDISAVIESFGTASKLIRDAGFDAVEIHAGHGYLLSQFLSPYTNHRNDDWGGSPENRRRLPVAVIEGVRRAVGTDFPILVKMNVSDGISGGLEIDEAVAGAAAFEKAGATALVPSCGFTSKTPFMMLRGNVPVKEMARNRPSSGERIATRLFGGIMVKTYIYKPLFLRKQSLEILREVSIPVIYVGGVLSKIGIMELMEDGFSLVQIGRATIRDPDFPNNLESGIIEESDCDICNRCVAAMDGNGVVCVTAEEAAVNQL